MKLIGKLKTKIARAETREGEKRILEAAGVLLTDNELNKVSGGVDERHLSFPTPEFDDAHDLPIYHQ